MNLYKFDYNDYGEYYFVMSEDKNNALQALKDYLKNIAEKEGQFRIGVKGKKFITYQWTEWEMWKNATTDRLPKGYTIEVIGPNIVQQEEYS